ITTSRKFSTPLRDVSPRRFPLTFLSRSCLLQSPQYRSQPPVAGLPQRAELVLVRPLHRVDQRALLLRLEPLPGGELAPPALEGRQQLLHEQSDAAVARRQVIGQVRAGGRPAQGRTERHGPVQLVHIDHALEDKIDTLSP